MKGHRRQVNHCCSDTRGTLIASASWDCTIKIWDGSSGKIKDTIIADAKPVNCAAFHPEGKLIVTGCWDSTLKIWDSLNKKRVAVSRLGYSRNQFYSPKEELQTNPKLHMGFVHYLKIVNTILTDNMSILKQNF